jgi:hypothetical protein
MGTIAKQNVMIHHLLARRRTPMFLRIYRNLPNSIIGNKFHTVSPACSKNIIPTGVYSFLILSSRYTGDYYQNLKLRVFQTVDSMVLTAVGLREGGC